MGKEAGGKNRVANDSRNGPSPWIIFDAFTVLDAACFIARGIFVVLRWVATCLSL